MYVFANELNEYKHVCICQWTKWVQVCMYLPMNWMSISMYVFANELNEYKYVCICQWTKWVEVCMYLPMN